MCGINQVGSLNWKRSNDKNILETEWRVYEDSLWKEITLKTISAFVKYSI